MHLPTAYVSAIRTELARAGITGWEIVTGTKHPRVLFVHVGRKRMYVFPASPSDSRRGVLNMVADLRRILGTSAPVRGKYGHGRRRRIGRDEAPMPETFAVRGDPWAVLKGWGDDGRNPETGRSDGG